MGLDIFFLFYSFWEFYFHVLMDCLGSRWGGGIYEWRGLCVFIMISIHGLGSYVSELCVFWMIPTYFILHSVPFCIVFSL